MAPKKGTRDYVISVPDDGLLTYDVGPWVEEKYRYAGMYAALFATGMKHRWDRRVYLDLFSGPGHSRIRSTQRIVLGSPLIAASLPDPFDRYIFADENPGALESLKNRADRLERPIDVAYVPGDANVVVDEIMGQIQGGPGKKTLSFCFLDPYRLNIHFETVRQLAHGKAIDFLILLALYVDANRNVARYVTDQSQTIDRFLGDPAWRPRWTAAERDGASIVTFLAGEYSSRMADLGYLPMSLEDMVKIRSYDRRLPLYYLAFYSRHKTGLRFWREVQKYANDQIPLDL